MKITYLLEGTSEDTFQTLAEKAVARRKRANCDEFMFCEDTLLRVEKDDTVESLYEKFIKNSAGDVEIEPETVNGDVPNPKWKKLREEAAVTIGAAKLANSNAQTVEEIAAIAKSSVDFATILVRQLEATE